MTRDWRTDRARWVKILEARTGKGLVDWNRRIRARGFRDAGDLRTWLSKSGVTGYPQQLLVMERFGYPEHVLAGGTRLIADQYADRPQLRPIFDAVVKVAQGCGPVVVQARKTFVALATARRTFARVQPTTRTRVDLGLRLDGQHAGGRLRANRHDTMRLRVGLASVSDVDSAVIAWIRRARMEST
ncbi:MAG TPA: DUF5655 domain-containing protein [Vicinamibacterales bacterium]|nr:DUF5655 domain-containing protein [Vicinamibacterales bacterium]